MAEAKSSSLDRPTDALLKLDYLAAPVAFEAVSTFYDKFEEAFDALRSHLGRTGVTHADMNRTYDCGEQISTDLASHLASSVPDVQSAWFNGQLYTWDEGLMVTPERNKVGHMLLGVYGNTGSYIRLTHKYATHNSQTIRNRKQIHPRIVSLAEWHRFIDDLDIVAKF